MTGSIKDIIAEDFQLATKNMLTRNKNLLDTLSKLQTSSARLSRAIVKSATHCGCIQVTCQREAEITGTLCGRCRSAIEKEMGDVLFYITGICNTLDLSIYDVMIKEKEALNLLGNFSLK